MVRALDRKLLRDLWRIKGQVVAIALVIGAGVAMFVMYRSTFDSLGLTQASYYDRYRFGDVFANAKRVPMGVVRQIEEIPGVARVEARVVAEVTLDVPGMDEPAMGRLVSIPAEGRPGLIDLYLRRGRWIAPGRPDEVLLSEAFADKNGFKPGDSLTAVLNGTKRKLRIVGIALSPEYVYSIRPGDMMPDPRRFGVLWMERKALSAVFDLEGSFNDAVLRLVPGAPEKEVMVRLDRVLAPYGGLGAVPRSLQTSHWYLQNELDQLRNVGNFLPMIFLGVAAFLLNVVLIRIVSVQREQIAALKALGYSNAALGAHYAKLSLGIALLGAILGTFTGARMGVGVTRLYTELFDFPVLLYKLYPFRVAQAAGVALAAATIGALGAVRRVAALPPAEAMRPEAPAAYGVTRLERLGLRKVLSPPARMILRNLSRRPLRTAVAVVGIAAGGSLVVVGNSLTGSIRTLLDEQLGVIQRQDATVTFIEPASARALHELQRLPGVVHAEPLRNAPVRIVHGHLSRRTAIQGIAAGARLQRVIDVDSLTPVELPAEGLVMSHALADVLGVREGDLVTVEVLEGSRPVRRLPVVRLVTENMGTSVYMRIDALQHLLRDGRSLSGAALEVEEAESEALYREIKNVPGVAAVARKAAFIESFEENFEKNMNVLIYFALIFSVIITFGVVYNTARISLSERSRELASLRVLGFSRTEISYIFLGELAVVTVAALPFVFLFGYGLAALAFQAFESELYRFPVVVSRQSFAMAGLAVLLSALVSGLAVRRQLDQLDLIAVLKTRE